jgi:zinc transporter 9
VQRQLLVFSSSAPLAALVTFFVLGNQTWFFASNSSLGLCLLFSAGTFLFTITVHVLPEIKREGEQPEWSVIAILVVGALAPAFLTVGHNHGH